MSRLTVILAVVALAIASCGTPAECGEGDSPVTVELDATALSEPGSRLEVCLNDLCNPEDPGSTEVSVNQVGRYPTPRNWVVSRVAVEVTTVVAEGELEVGCSADPQTKRIRLDELGQQTIDS